MHIKTFKGGYDDNFSYIISHQGQALILDLTINPLTLLQHIKEHNLTLIGAVIMHSHADHLVGLQIYKERNIPLFAHTSCPIKHDQALQDNQTIQLANLNFIVLHTPGHRFDCICLHAQNHLFTTDVLFINGCGRVDFPGSDPEKQFLSLQRLQTFPDDTIIYPGHDYGPTPTDTLANQKRTNPYLNLSKQEFLTLRT